MMEVIKTWILGVAAAALVTGIATSIVPAGKLRRTVGLICGFLTIAVMIGPLRELDIEAYSMYMVEYRDLSGEYGISLENENERLMRVIIEERSAAYILDKARDMGIEDDIEAHVTTRKGEDGYPYPYRAELKTAPLTGEQKQELSRYMEVELGIAAAEQNWIDG